MIYLLGSAETGWICTSLPNLVELNACLSWFILVSRIEFAFTGSIVSILLRAIIKLSDNISANVD